MIDKFGRLVVVTALALASTVLPAQIADTSNENIATAHEIRISLPEGDPPIVTVVPEDNQVMVELPRGSVFPLDFAASSNGLLRGGEVTSLDDTRVQLRLEMAIGLLDRVIFGNDSIVLRFESRFNTQSDTTDQGDLYLLGPGDKIMVTVHNHPELTSHLTITQEGIVNVPLVGDIQVTGFSTRQFASRMAELLGRSYLVDPQVEIEIEEYRSQWVLVTGEVRLPGRVFLRGGTRLKEVLSVAGGFNDFSGELITISRKSRETGQFITHQVERLSFESGAADPVVRHGDIIDVGRSAYCYLQGEVRSPGKVRIERGLTLLRAISLAGGLTDWADRKSITVLYGEGSDKPDDVYNIKQIMSGKQEDPKLFGNEVIIVHRRFF